ncbi:MAG TPA: ATP-binding cassette domain-containing protein [Alkalispirochaeta sp.]|nr:ATP-binding cassette domain-containing protein [Alkalispirochaeta sp.]
MVAVSDVSASVLPGNFTTIVALSGCGKTTLLPWHSAYPHALSGGMAQRVNLARALCRQQGLWLLDEPFSALDAINRRALQTELLRLWAEAGPTVVLVTHDVPEAVLLSDRILTMSAGRIISDRRVSLPRPRTTGDPAFGAMVADTFATIS